MRMQPPIVLCKRSRIPATVLLRSMTFGSSRCRREKDSSWSVSRAPRSAAAHIAKTLHQLAVVGGLG